MIRQVARCFGCPCVMQPPEGVTWYRPAADSDPGPMVTVVAVFAIPPELLRFVRQADNCWTVKGFLLDAADSSEYSHRVNASVPWNQVGLCPFGVPRPVAAVHLNDAGQWVIGIGPNAVRDAVRDLAKTWLGPHRFTPARDAAAGDGS